jgi:hypothetical protein
MTTRVTVHASNWPVEVQTEDKDPAGNLVDHQLPPTKVLPGQWQDFYFHSGRDLRVKELPVPSKE